VCFQIQDDLDAAERGAIEVHVTVDSGPDRWCFFITPQALSTCGDLLSGSSVRIQTEEVIQSTLDNLADEGLLLSHTDAIASSDLFRKLVSCPAGCVATNCWQ